MTSSFLRPALALHAVVFIACFAGPVLAQSNAQAATVENSQPARPNFIFIITDDQRWDALSCVQKEQGEKGLFPWFKTPNIDRIAAEGARFTNAFVVHSLCSPSRASFLSGLHTCQHGVHHNWQPLPQDLPTWATGLQSAGYDTVYMGKWHMGQQAERPGFSTVFSYVGQGQYFDCEFLENGKPVATQGWVDNVTTDHAIAYLEQQHDQPFGMVIGFKTPHEPRKPEQRFKKDFADDHLTIPATYELIPPFRPKGYRPLKWETRIFDRKNYFRCLEGIDENVGRILETLDRQGLTENTVLFFTSDNGYYLGEHASHDKRTAYEESIRIPLLMRYPRMIQPGTVINEIVLNIDVAPTILDLAKKQPQKMSGKSLAPLFSGKAPASWNNRAFLYENYQDPEFPKVTFDILTMRTGNSKLVTYPGHPEWTEAFDLTADPLEMNNLYQAASFASQREELERQFKAMLMKVGLAPVSRSK